MGIFQDWRSRRRRNRREVVELACNGLANAPTIDTDSDDEKAVVVDQMIQLRVLVLRARRYSRRQSVTFRLFSEADAWLTSWLDTWAENDLSYLHERKLHEHMVKRLESIATRLSNALQSEDRTS